MLAISNIQYRLELNNIKYIHTNTKTIKDCLKWLKLSKIRSLQNAEPDMKSPVVKDIDTDNYWGKRNNFAAEENEYRVQNRDFDGRAVDPGTRDLYFTYFGVFRS